MEKKLNDKSNLVYPELSYKIVGILYDVYNELGYGYQEKYYEKAVAKALEQEGLKYKEQLHIPFEFKNQKICTKIRISILVSISN